MKFWHRMSRCILTNGTLLYVLLLKYKRNYIPIAIPDLENELEIKRTGHGRG